MEIEFAPDGVAAAEIERNIVARRINEPAADAIFRVINFSAVQLGGKDRVVPVRPERAAVEFAARPEIPLVVRRINHPRLRQHADDFPLVVRFPDQPRERDHRKAPTKKGGIYSGEQIQVIRLEDEDAAEGDRRVERGVGEIVLGVNAGLDLNERADVVVVHVIDPEDNRDALQMVGDRRSGRSKIKAIVFDAEMQIKMAAEEEPVGVGKRILDGRLVAEASAPAQVALEDVTRFDLNEVERNLGRLRIQERLDHRFLGAAQNGKTKKKKRCAKLEADGPSHWRGS